jgi:hypothetical protein
VRKVFKRLRRMRGKYLSLDGDSVFKRIRRMRGKDLCVNGEDAKKILAYSPNTPRDVKVSISPKIIIRIKNF